MNHIERLIEEMCPNGVPFIPVSKAFIQPKVPKGLRRSQYEASGPYPIIDQGRKEICGYTRRGDHLISDGPHIIFGDHTRSIKYTPKTYALGADGTKVLSPRNGIEPRFAFHYLKSLKITDRGYNRHWPILKEMPFPIPPVEVQREIVEILDKFSKLEAELEAELEARNTQLNAVRESLFTNLEDYTTAPLSTITVESYSGMTPRATEKRYYDGGTIPWLRSQDINFNIIQNATSFITEKALRETSLQMIPSNCLIVAISGASAGRSATNAFPTTTNQHCCCLKIDASKADLRYVYHWIASNYLVLKNMGRGARGDLNHSIIKSLPIKLPPIEVQQSCARMLDNLSNLVSSHVDGLPAEIAARRQQYEYYRDRLLTFKELQ